MVVAGGGSAGKGRRCRSALVACCFIHTTVRVDADPPPFFVVRSPRPLFERDLDLSFTPWICDRRLLSVPLPPVGAAGAV